MCMAAAGSAEAVGVGAVGLLAAAAVLAVLAAQEAGCPVGKEDGAGEEVAGVAVEGSRWVAETVGEGMATAVVVWVAKAAAAEGAVDSAAAEVEGEAVWAAAAAAAALVVALEAASAMAVVSGGVAEAWAASGSVV